MAVLQVRRASAVGALTIAVMGVAACMPWPSSWLGESGYHVGVIGDSLVRGAEAGSGLDPNDPDRYLSQALADRGYRASVAAAVGAETKELVEIAPFPEPGVDIPVVALGTNDMHGGSVPLDIAIANIVDYLDTHPVACTALVTIVDTTPWGLDVTAPPYNAELARIAAERDDVILADWEAEVDAHPEYVGEDGVHQTPAGQDAYRSLILNAVDECAAVIASTTTTTTVEESTTTTTVEESTTTTTVDESTTTTIEG